MYKVPEFKVFDIKEHKVRSIVRLSFSDRVLQRFLVKKEVNRIVAVRPFYIESDIEGRQTYLKGGPKSGRGDMTTSVYQRDEGAITEPYKIYCKHKFDGDVHKLVTEVHYMGKKIHSHETIY